MDVEAHGERVGSALCCRKASGKEEGSGRASE